MTASQTTILVVEDDSAIRRGLTDALKYAGYHVREAVDGRSAIAQLTDADVDLVMLDVMLPGGMDGFAILEAIRISHPVLPVIMVTARGAESDRVRGLKHGADDYVVKPFGALEVLARVEAVLRRSPGRVNAVETLKWDGCTADLRRHELQTENGEVIALSDREAEILRFLGMNRSRVVNRDELLQHVWKLDPKGLETRTVDMHIARLREKLAGAVDGTEANSLIQTVRGKGYKLGDAVRTGEA
ncbi:MAG TPA: response regulator transcription factor [Phycisphaerales bacterium]|nr:response regulator transcription factor [Phycisphaerales bacterium]